MSKFTPGPWEAGLARMNEPDKRNIWAVSLQVASAKSPWLKQEVQEANANLIAAAPEMYEALKAVQRTLSAIDTSEIAQAIDTALAKAEGDQ